jgi:hypothetical protein
VLVACAKRVSTNAHVQANLELIVMRMQFARTPKRATIANADLASLMFQARSVCYPDVAAWKRLTNALRKNLTIALRTQSVKMPRKDMFAPAGNNHFE